MYGQALNNLAVLYDDEGRYAEAETLYKQALAVTEKALGPEHVEVGTYLSNLAGVYKAQGRYAEAVPLLKRALAIAEKKQGPDHPSVAYRLNNLAVIYRAQGRYPEAEAYYKRSLAIFEKSLGPDHRNVGQTLNNLAVLYNTQGRYADAVPLMKRAMNITEKALGPKHPDMVIRLNNLAWVYEKQGRLKDAEALYRRSLAIGETALGAEHPDVINSRENLAALYKSGGRLAEAEPLLREVLAAKEKRFGRDHPSVAESLTQLGDLYRLEGKCEQADPLFVRALAVSKGEIKEVPVLFATDRKRDAKQASVAFGGERDSQISLGLADVTIPGETKGRSEQEKLIKQEPAHPGKKEVAAPEAGSERRLAMRCIQIVKDKQIIELATRRLAVSKTYPNQVLVFVHGYNVSFDNAVRRAAQIAYDLKFDGGTFLFSWPSRGRWDPRAYFSDSDTVDIAAEHLRQFLETIVAKTKTPRINFIAHSMGNLVLLRALDKIGSEYPDLRKAVGEIIDAAPDVDTDVFKQLVSKIIAMGGRLTLYASANDRALWLSGLLRNGSRAGFISAHRPLIVAGVDTIDITRAGTSLFSLNHDVYTASPKIIEDMRRIFESGTRPPDLRTNDFEKVMSKDGAYWRLKAPVPTSQ